LLILIRDLIEAMKEFTKLFGAEVEGKAKSEESKSVEKLDPKEQELVDRVLADDRIIAAMRDPAVQDVLAMAQSGRHADLFKMLASDPSLKQKINILRDSGLIRFEN
jgi:hypothetical protein